MFIVRHLTAVTSVGLSGYLLVFYVAPGHSVGYICQNRMHILCLPQVVVHMVGGVN